MQTHKILSAVMFIEFISFMEKLIEYTESCHKNHDVYFSVTWRHCQFSGVDVDKVVEF